MPFNPFEVWQNFLIKKYQLPGIKSYAILSLNTELRIFCKKGFSLTLFIHNISNGFKSISDGQYVIQIISKLESISHKQDAIG